ncbi:uncharacterized protein [Amphiura filiformis]|uniref:uncharacterized protein n=1 Tax=Amphiura filiformis TaxID=82378 RepID=UPI003B2221B1
MATFVGSLNLWCFLLYLFVIGAHGQCSIQNLRVNSLTSSSIGVAWDCNENDNEFRVKYQFLNSKQCNDGINSHSFDQINTDWIVYPNTTINYQIYSNSTYLVTVQSRKWRQDRFVLGVEHEGINFTTPEAMVLTVSGINSYKSMQATWNAVPDRCLHFEYQLLLEDGAVVKEGIVSNSDILISGLECDTNYIFRLRYKMITKSEPWSDWFSTPHRTYFHDASESHVRVKAVTSNSATFIWQPLQCNNKTYTIEYHYELQL